MAAKSSDPYGALLTDLYQLVMMQVYVERDMLQTASFEFCVPKLPRTRGYLVACGLAPLVEVLENLQVTSKELKFLKSTGRFSKAFLSYLKDLRFEGDIDAMPEGTVFFAGEPLLRITAPLPVAQLIESRLMNILHAQVLVASKAARVVTSAPECILIDFGLRRAHGAEAAMFAARAAYSAGFAGTSNALASLEYGIPCFGTMSQGLVRAIGDERDALMAFASSQPQHVELPLTPGDATASARRVISMAAPITEAGGTITGVRLSGENMADRARTVRRILDRAEHNKVKIMAGGNLDEYRIAEIILQGAPIDGFGVGSVLDTSADAPNLAASYQLVTLDGKSVTIGDRADEMLPGEKQVWRHYAPPRQRMTHDTVTLTEESVDGAEPLLEPVLRAGERVGELPSLDAIRKRARTQLERLPEHLKLLGTDPRYPVEFSSLVKARARAGQRARKGK